MRYRKTKTVLSIFCQFPSHRNELAFQRRQLPMGLDQQDSGPPSPYIIGEGNADVTPSVSLRRSRRRRFVSPRNGNSWSPSHSRQDDAGCDSSAPTTALLPSLRLMLDVGSFPFPEMLVAPDDDNEFLREVRRRDMLKDDMIMFYRELYKLQIRDGDTISYTPPDAAIGSLSSPIKTRGISCAKRTNG
jgi:hypothetical protein